MAIYEHTAKYVGMPVEEWSPDTGIRDPEGTIYRVTLDWDDAEEGLTWTDRFAAFLEDPASERIRGIVVGNWGTEGETSEAVVEALVAARDRFPDLRAIFLGDIISEENEISWIHQSDVSPLLDAYPELEHFRVRGGEGLSFGSLRHDRL